MRFSAFDAELARDSDNTFSFSTCTMIKCIQKMKCKAEQEMIKQSY